MFVLDPKSALRKVQHQEEKKQPSGKNFFPSNKEISLHPAGLEI